MVTAADVSVPAAGEQAGIAGTPLRRLWRMHAWWMLPLVLIGLLMSGPRQSALDRWTVGDLAIAPCARADSDPWQSIARGSMFRRGDCWLVRIPREPATMLLPSDLLLFGLHADADVYDDGRIVVARDTTRSRTTHAGYRHVRLPALTQPSDGAEILLTVRSSGGDRPWIRLARVALAPEGALSDWLRAHDLRQRDGARLSLALMFALLIVVTPMLVRRRETVSLWYAASLAGAGTYVAQFASDILPFGIPVDARSTLAHVGLILATWATLRFSCAMTVRSLPRWIDIATAVAIALLVLLTLAPEVPLALFWHLLWRALMLAMMCWLALHWWQQRRLDLRPGGAWFAGAVGALIVLGIHDTVRALEPALAPSSAYLLHWGILYLVILMFAALLTRLLDGLDVAETAGERLKLALADRTSELEAEYARRRAAESEAMIANERHRLMRDMHDGIGGQIVALIAQAEQRSIAPETIATQLRRTLDDLRLVIDSLDSACADLGVALGMLRGRLTPLLAGLPTEVRWQTAQLPDLPNAPPGTVLGVLRIVQEALTNALKHANAGTVTIEAAWQAPLLEINIRDDGRGFDRELITAGRGLSSLAHRAAAIGGRLIVISAPGQGTRVSLRLPLGHGTHDGAATQ